MFDGATIKTCIPPWMLYTWPTNVCTHTHTYTLAHIHKATQTLNTICWLRCFAVGCLKHTWSSFEIELADSLASDHAILSIAQLLLLRQYFLWFFSPHPSTLVPDSLNWPICGVYIYILWTNCRYSLAISTIHVNEH